MLLLDNLREIFVVHFLSDILIVNITPSTMSMTGYLKMVDDHDLLHLNSHPEQVEELIDQECDKAELLDVDKTWAALHFAIAGDVYPDGDPILVGAMVGQHIVDFDLDYGTPGYLLSEDVAELVTQLDQITEEDIEDALGSERFQESDIYPFGNESEEEIIEYVLPYFKKLRDFYRLAKEKGKGVLVLIM